jgi:hypothetical protein
MRAFWELSSCRYFGSGAIGPIPWNRVCEYAEKKGLDGSLIAVFEVVMRELDEEYLRYQRDEQRQRLDK